MVGAVGPTGSCAPERGDEDHYRQEEEDPRHLQPQNAADPPEGAQKAAYATNDSPGGSRCRRAGCFLDVSASV